MSADATPEDQESGANEAPRETTINDSSEWFVEFSRNRFRLSDDQLRTVVAEAEEQGVAPHEHALRTGVLDAVQADVISTLLAGNEVLPDYEFLDMIGKGAMGVVYRARQTSLDRVVAIKTILLGKARSAGLISRFEQEAKTIARLRHPNVVSAYDFHKREGRLYLVLEFLDGDTLDDWLGQRGVLDESTTWHLIRQAAAGLAHAAEHNVVHRDIKPGNLFVVKPPAGFPLPAGIPLLKITDFGLALLASEEEDATRLTGDGMSLGTPAFMAPEQLGSSDVDHRADIYALGITAFEMMHGSTPYKGRSLVVLMSDKVNKPVPRLSELDESISPVSSELVADMLAVDPEDRPCDYTELLSRIDAILENAPQVNRNVARPVVLHGASDDSSAETIAVLSQTPAATAGKDLESRADRRRYLMIGLPVIALVAIALAFLPHLFSHVGPPGVATRMELAGRGESLFDAESIAGWQTAAGHVTPGLDVDKADVLRVGGTVRRALPDYEHYRITLGLDLHTAPEVQFHFDFQEDARRRLVLKITRERALVGVLTGSQGELTVVEPALEFSTDPWTVEEDEVVYRAVLITREPGRWAVSFDGRPVGALPKPEAGQKPMLGIIVPAKEIALEGNFVEELQVAGPEAAPGK